MLLAGVPLDRSVSGLSGGERRRCSLSRLLLGDHDLLILDEPTNHLDVEAVDWLARHLAARGAAVLVVTHDRWFLDAVCERTWEVHDGVVDEYDGGYAAYVLARAERTRQAAASREPPAQPGPQGARLAAPRGAGPDLQAAVPDRRGERAHRGRAASAGPTRAGALRGAAAGQGRDRRRGRRPGRRGAEAARARDLAAGARRPDRSGRGQRVPGKTSVLRLLAGELAPGRGPGAHRPDRGARPPDPAPGRPGPRDPGPRLGRGVGAGRAHRGR